MGQVTHVLAYPPMLVDTQLHGTDLLAEPQTSARLSAAVVLAVLAIAGYRWLRAGDNRATLVMIVGVLVAAGLANGSKVPGGVEEGRLSFYHWIWPLSFFVLLALANVVIDLVRHAVRAWLARSGGEAGAALQDALGRWLPRTPTATLTVVSALEIYLITEPSELEHALDWHSAGFNRGR